MEDFRCFEDGSLWIMIILIFLLLSGSKGGGLCGLDCLFGNFFDGCNNTWLWIMIAFLVYWIFAKGSCGSIFRSEIQ